MVGRASFLDFLAIIARNAIGVLIVHGFGALVRRRFARAR